MAKLKTQGLYIYLFYCLYCLSSAESQLLKLIVLEYLVINNVEGKKDGKQD